jgi:hypothetical protein
MAKAAANHIMVQLMAVFLSEQAAEGVPNSPAVWPLAVVAKGLGSMTWPTNNGRLCSLERNAHQAKPWMWPDCSENGMQHSSLAVAAHGQRMAEPMNGMANQGSAQSLAMASNSTLV